MSASQASGMGRSMLINAGGTFCSRIFGLLRDVAMTWYWGGSGNAQGAFHLAFSIPNMFRTLFGEGAFTASFVPAVSAKLEQDDRAGAWRLAERTISLQILALSALVLVVSCLSVCVLYFLPGGIRPHIPLTFRILPLLMPYALLICVAGSFASILNSLRRFAIPSLNPVIFNVCQITAVLLLSLFWRNDEPVSLYCFCGSIILAGTLQALSLMLACRRQGFVFHFRPVWRDADVQAVCRRFVPATIGAGATQINQLLDKVMVGWLGPLGVSSIAYSNHLIYLPVGLFGVAMGVVCLTDMSRSASRHDSVAMANSLDFALRMVLFLCLPCAVLFGVLAVPVVQMMYYRGAFNEASVRACVWALMFYLPGLPAFCCMKVATNPHHANNDTKTPVKVALWCILLNFVLNISLLLPLRQGGLALSTSICSWVNVVTLLLLARRHVPAWSIGSSIRAALGLLLSAAFGGACAWLTAHELPEMRAWGTFWESVVTVVVAGFAGILGYLVGCLVLRRPEPWELVASLRRGKA